jgi:hypothetical protein
MYSNYIVGLLRFIVLLLLGWISVIMMLYVDYYRLQYYEQP